MQIQKLCLVCGAQTSISISSFSPCRKAKARRKKKGRSRTKDDDDEENIRLRKRKDGQHGVEKCEKENEGENQNTTGGSRRDDENYKLSNLVTTASCFDQIFVFDERYLNFSSSPKLRCRV